MIAAFLIGLFGSVHCLGMCGPLMLTFTRSKQRNSLVSFLVYHVGRLAVYSVIGLLFGVLSMSMFFFQFQKFGAIILGFLIILVYGFPKLRNRAEGMYYHSRFYSKVKRYLTGMYSGKAKWLAAGMLNGLLPCGMIYLAAAGAILAGGMLASIRFMLLFGFGTIPMLLGLTLAANHMPGISRNLSNLTTPVAMISGLLLIIRGVFIENPDLNQLLQLQIGKLMSVCGL